MSPNAVVHWNVADRIVVDRTDSYQVAASRTGQDQFLRVRALDGILRLPGGAPGAKADHFQIVSLAETLDEVEAQVNPRLGRGLAESQADVGPAV